LGFKQEFLPIILTRCEKQVVCALRIFEAFYAFENLEVGGVIINDVPSVRVDAQPYGGVKGSGIGREGIRWAMQDFSEVRVMLMKNVGKL